MQNSLVKKGLVLVILVLFVFSNIIPIISSTIEGSNELKIKKSVEKLNRGILYVGGDGPGNYSKIQDAVDNASNGDTVYVYTGTYFENVVLDKSIDLIGDNVEDTIIDGEENGNVVYVSADWVNISNFTIKNSGPFFCGINIVSDNNNISSNSISNNSYGIEIITSKNNNIINNTITSNNYSGIGIDESPNNNVIGNVITSNNGCGIGIAFYGDNTIANNIIFNNNYGISVWANSNDNISDNNISNNNRGLYLEDFDNCIVSNNIISENNWYGIWIESSKGNVIHNNAIFSNNGSGIYLIDSSTNNNISSNNINSNEDGIYHSSSSNNIITNNNISLNSKCGIFSSESYNCIISYNTIKMNNDEGIMFDFSRNHVIHCNDIASCTGIGIKIFGFESDNNIFYHNNLIDNIPQNAYDPENNIWYNSTFQEGNYYDDYNGEDADGDGIGDTPYNISGGDNQDLYPLMQPYGSPIADFVYYSNNRTFDGSSSYDMDGEIILYEWDFDDGTTGEGKVITHVYNDSNTYNITLTVTDNSGYQSSITKSIEIEANHPPGKPTINGPLSGKKGTMYSYMFVAEDPNGDDIFYEINWGDGITDPLDGPHESNKVITRDHTWAEKGSYIIMARAIDIYDAEGEWGILEITMPKTFNLYFSFVNRLIECFPNLYLMFNFFFNL